MNRITFSTTLVLAAAAPFAMHGADFPENPNRLSLGPRFGLNFKADFRNNAPPVNPGPAAGGADHTYNDGYVLLDSSGNAGGLTWNWGYQNASQVVEGTMQFHAIQSSSASGASSRAGSEFFDDPQYGAELTYQRVLGGLPFLPDGNWGLEAAFGFTDLDLRANRSATGPATVTTDTYQLNGVLPPGAGYNGTFQGPGALLGDTPTRTTAADIATLTSHQKLSGQLYSIRLGPFAEFYFTHQLSLAASVGLTLAPASVDYDFSETTTLAGGGTSVASGHSSKTDLLYGPYVSATLRYDFNKHWGLYVGAQFQSLTDLEQTIGSRTARLDQGATVYGIAGASVRF
ncbi:MAG TPA: hypothetical protein VN578_19725 [Candidatus Binatia bacterium]|jgi:hypothetical protein|nr:hypothetical protein [Candidatus Binatia bacterium]